MKKQFLLFLLLVMFGIGSVNATCYKSTCDGAVKYTDKYGDLTTCKYDKVDDYYCSVNQCAINVTESGNGSNCGRCGRSYTWNSSTNRCEISQYDQELFDNASCADNAKDIKECSKCDGYKWSTATGKCVLDTSKTTKVSCGNIDGIPKKIPDLTSDVVNILQIAVPVILVIMGSIDLLKGVMAQKDDEIKKGQKILIKRLIVAALIFFIVVIVKFIVSVVADNTNTNNIIECIDCFISGDCK